METKLRQPETLDKQQLARKCEIRGSWNLQVRNQRQHLSKVRQQLLTDLVLGSTNHPHALSEFPSPNSVAPSPVLNTTVGNAPRCLSTK